MERPLRIEVVYDYVKFCVATKNVKVADFHYEYKPYHRKQSTLDLLRKAKERRIIFPPRIFCLQNIAARLIEYQNIPLLDMYEQKSKDPKVYYIMALTGAYSLICFRKGKKNLTYAFCTTPSYPAIGDFNEIDPTKYGKDTLPEMKYPKDWDELDWKIYIERNDPLRSSVKVGRKIGVSYHTVLDRFKNILADCQIWLPFFPNGYKQYVPYVLTLNTEYEIGILKELEKLDRSSYVYKVNDTLILTLFFDRYLEIKKFLLLEKKGVIHNLRVSFPLNYENVFEF
jgi:hypothetical protein